MIQFNRGLMSNTITDRESLTTLLLTEIPQLSGAQQRLAQYLVNHAEQAPFMTTTELAHAAGVSQSTVTRFALRLGFDSYASFTSTLSAVLLSEIDRIAPAERFERSASATRFSELLAQETRHLRSLTRVVESDSFKRSTSLIASAQRVIVAGFAAASALSSHVHLYLSRLRPDVINIVNLDAPVLTQLTHWNEQDCAVLFSVPRMTRDAVEFMQLASSQGISTILITDSLGTAHAASAREVLVIPVTLGPTTAIPAAMLTLGSLLVDAVALEQPDRTLATLRNFESTAKTTQFFAKGSTPRNPYWEQQLRTFMHDQLETVPRDE